MKSISKLSFHGILLAILGASLASAQDTAPPIFECDVYPIFAKHCAGCHFPEAERLKGGLELSTAALTIEGGDEFDGVVPGKPDESPLVRSIEHTHEPHMPPPDKFPKLSDEDIALIRAWIAGGAQSDPSIETPRPQLTATPELDDVNAAVSSIAFLSKDNELLLAQGTLGAVSIAKVTQSTGALEPLTKLTGHAEMVRALAVSPDGALLAAAGGRPGVAGEVKLWSTADWSVAREWTGHRDNVLAAAFSPDGSKLATASYDKTAIIWDATAGEAIQTLKDHVDAVYAIAFSPDGQHVATGAGDRTVKVWDVATGKMLATITDALDAVHAVSFSPDGKHLAVGGADKMIRLYEAVKVGSAVDQSALSMASLTASSFAHEGAVLQLAFSPDGATLFSTAEDRAVKAWDATNLTEKTVFEAQPDWPLALAASGDGALIAVGRYDGSAAVYASTGEPLGVPEPVKAASSDVQTTDVDALFIRATVPPSLSRVSPTRLHRGGTFTLDVSGKNLDKAKPTIFASGVTVELAELEEMPEPEAKAGQRAVGTGANIFDNARPFKAKLNVTIAEDASIGSRSIVFETATGLTNSQTITILPKPDIAEQKPEDGGPQRIEWPGVVIGKIGAAGERDRYSFHAEAGQEIVFALTDTNLTPIIQLYDANGALLADSTETSPDPGRLGYRFETAGEYAIEIGDRDLRGNLGYRLHVGEFPWAVEWWPLGVAAGGAREVQVSGFNLGGDRLTVEAPAEAHYGARVTLPVSVPEDSPIALPRLAVGPAEEVFEVEPNDAPESAHGLTAPGVANGRFDSATDADLYRVQFPSGETYYIETEAARLGAPVDTFIEILSPNGELLQRGVIRCVAQTHLTLNDRDSRQSGLRIASWTDLAMGDYVMVGSEIIKVFDLPDYGDEDCAFVAYPNGQRRGFFGTTPEHHAVDSSVYKIEVHPPGTGFAPNGMPTFPLYWRNDDGFFDDGSASGDSFLEFTAPDDGEYLIRITETRGQSGSNCAYRLLVRKPQPDFDVFVSPYRVNISPGSRTPVEVRVRRKDGFDGAVAIAVHDLPEGFTMEPGTVLPGEDRVTLSLAAGPDVASTDLNASFRVTADAELNGAAVTREAKLGSIAVSEIQPDLIVVNGEHAVTLAQDGASTISVRLDRFNGFDGRVPIDVLNLPYGVRVLDTGLNGVLVREGETDRSMELYAEPWVPAMSRTIYIQARIETSSPMKPEFLSQPIQLHIGNVQTAANAERN